jgi:hypothetical protein
MTDILFPSGQRCHCNDEEKIKMIIEIDMKCWKNIHPHELNVFDFTSWAGNDEGAHPGNFFARNPIKEFAEGGNYRLSFPLWHDMDKWYTNINVKIPLVGRFGDSVAFRDLSEVLKRDTGTIFSLLSHENDSSIVCGSPGEVSNNYPSVDAFDEINRINTRKPSSYHHDRYRRQRKQVWIEIALKSPDQLRQRVGW